MHSNRRTDSVRFEDARGIGGAQEESDCVKEMGSAAL